MSGLLGSLQGAIGSPGVINGLIGNKVNSINTNTDYGMSFGNGGVPQQTEPLSPINQIRSPSYTPPVFNPYGINMNPNQVVNQGIQPNGIPSGLNPLVHQANPNNGIPSGLNPLVHKANPNNGGGRMYIGGPPSNNGYSLNGNNTPINVSPIPNNNQQSPVVSSGMNSVRNNMLPNGTNALATTNVGTQHGLPPGSNPNNTNSINRLRQTLNNRA